MASKKKPAVEINVRCEKCGKITVHSLLNLKHILSGETTEKIYRCNTCGHQIKK